LKDFETDDTRGALRGGEPKDGARWPGPAQKRKAKVSKLCHLIDYRKKMRQVSVVLQNFIKFCKKLI